MIVYMVCCDFDFEPLKIYALFLDILLAEEYINNRRKNLNDYDAIIIPYNIRESSDLVENDY